MTQAQARKKLLRGFPHKKQAAKYWAAVLLKHHRTVSDYIRDGFPVQGRAQLLQMIERHEPVWFQVLDGGLWMGIGRFDELAFMDCPWAQIFEPRPKADGDGLTTDAHASRLIPTAIDGWFAATHGESREKYPRLRSRKPVPQSEQWIADRKQVWLAAYDFRKSLS